MARKIEFDQCGMAVVSCEVRSFPSVAEVQAAQNEFKAVEEAEIKKIGHGTASVYTRVTAGERASKLRPDLRKIINEASANQSVLPIGECTHGQLVVPANAEPQTIRVEACPTEHGGNFLPLVDVAGNFVTISVKPGTMQYLPPSFFEASFVRLHGEPGKVLPVTLLVYGREMLGSSRRQAKVRSVLPRTPSERKADKAMNIRGSSRAQLHVAEDAVPQQVFVFACLEEESEPLQLLDAMGNPVSFAVAPGRAHTLPPIVLQQSYVRFVAEKDFDAMLVL